MTPRSIRRAQERKARKEMVRKARGAALKSDQFAATAFSPVIGPLPDAEQFETRPVSAAQLAANRANAQLSTGARTSQGKTKASLNAVKTALTGRTVLLPSDDAAGYEQHLASYGAEFQPVGQRECDLVQSIADSTWRLKRIPGLESAIFAQGYVEFAEHFEEHDPSARPALIEVQTFLKYEKQIRNLQLQEARLVRRREKETAELRALQQERGGNQQQALEEVAQRYAAAKANQTCDLTSNGFEFSSEEIEQRLEQIRLASPGSNPAKRMARAA